MKNISILIIVFFIIILTIFFFRYEVFVFQDDLYLYNRLTGNISKKNLKTEILQIKDELLKEDLKASLLRANISKVFIKDTSLTKISSDSFKLSGYIHNYSDISIINVILLIEFFGGEKLIDSKIINVNEIVYKNSVRGFMINFNTGLPIYNYNNFSVKVIDSKKWR